MPIPFQVVVCASVVPDPLQTLEPITGPTGPALKNEMMLPAILDPWAAHALYEGANLAKKVPLQLVAVDGPSSGFADAQQTATALATAIRNIPGIDLTKVLLFGGWESASRSAGVTLQLVGEELGIVDQFQGVDAITPKDDGSLEVLERVEGARHQVSLCAGAPAVLGWATGSLGEPQNNPQVGMANMRTIMPGLQKAVAAKITSDGLQYSNVATPKQQRETRIVKDVPADDIAKEIVQWIGRE